MKRITMRNKLAKPVRARLIPKSERDALAQAEAMRIGNLLALSEQIALALYEAGAFSKSTFCSSATRIWLDGRCMFPDRLAILETELRASGLLRKEAIAPGPIARAWQSALASILAT